MANYLVTGEYYRGNEKVFPSQFSPLYALSGAIGIYNESSSGEALIAALNNNAPYLLPYVTITPETTEISRVMEVFDTLILKLYVTDFETSHFKKTMGEGMLHLCIC